MFDNSLYQKHICDDAVIWKALLHEKAMPIVKSELIETNLAMQARGFDFEDGDIIRSRRSGIVQPFSELKDKRKIQQLCENILDGIYSEDMDDDVMIDHVPESFALWDVFAPKGQVSLRVVMRGPVFESATIRVPQKKYVMEVILDVVKGTVVEMNHKEGLFAFEQNAYDIVVPFWSEMLRNAYRAWSLVQTESIVVDFVFDSKGKAYIYDMQRRHIPFDSTKSSVGVESFEDALHLTKELQLLTE